MKQLSQFLAEANDSPDDLKKEVLPQKAAEGVVQLQKQLTDVLGSGYKVQAFVMNLGHSPTLRVNGVNPANGIWQNSPAIVSLMMHLSGTMKITRDMKEVAWETTRITSRQIPFRKIKSSKSIEDANNKLIAWFKKVKPIMDELMGYKS